MKSAKVDEEQLNQDRSRCMLGERTCNAVKQVYVWNRLCVLIQKPAVGRHAQEPAARGAYLRSDSRGSVLG